MILPIRTDYRMSGRPWVNYALLAINIGVYLMGYHAGTAQGAERIREWMLYPQAPELSQFFTCVFLHGGFWHLFGNMVFLWVFGNAMNDKFGHLGYAGFYLAGGVLAGVGYIVLGGTAPVLGASGAISAVTGAYLVLLPRVRVTLLLILYLITTFEVSSLYFLLFQFVFNSWMTVDVITGPEGAGGVAYSAHVSGYVFGIVIAAALLAARVLPRDAFDLLNLIRGRFRRSRYRRMVSRGYDPFQRVGGVAGPAQGPRRKVRAKTVGSAPSDTLSARELQLRKDITQACERHDMDTAAERYLQLIQIADDAVLSQQNQLDVANQLMATQRYPAAADAYERFLRHYARHEYAGDIYLMLGVLYGRYLHQYDRAEERLNRALQRLKDTKKREMAEGELAGMRRRRRF